MRPNPSFPSTLCTFLKRARKTIYACLCRFMHVFASGVKSARVVARNLTCSHGCCYGKCGWWGVGEIYLTFLERAHTLIATACASTLECLYSSCLSNSFAVVFQDSDNFLSGQVKISRVGKKQRTQWHDAARILISFPPHAKTHLFSFQTPRIAISLHSTIFCDVFDPTHLQTTTKKKHCKVRTLTWKTQ